MKLIMSFYDMLEKEKIVNSIHQNSLEIEVLKYLLEWLIGENDSLYCKNMQYKSTIGIIKKIVNCGQKDKDVRRIIKEIVEDE